MGVFSMYKTDVYYDYREDLNDSYGYFAAEKEAEIERLPTSPIGLFWENNVSLELASQFMELILVKYNFNLN